jgi:hypothetical protein
MLPLAMVAVFWSAVAVLISDATGSLVAYGAVSGGVLTAVVVVGYLLVRRGSQPEAAADELANDPIVTGESRGLGYMLLQVLGGLLAIPLLLHNALLRVLDRLATLAPETAAAGDGEKAITRSEGSGD